MEVEGSGSTVVDPPVRLLETEEVREGVPAQLLGLDALLERQVFGDIIFSLCVTQTVK